MNTEPPLLRGHRLSPSFTDSAIDIELTDSTQSDDDSTPKPSNAHVNSLNQRILQIAHLAANNSLQELSIDDCAALSRHLDKLETLLDPRAGISHVIALNRPSSSSSNLIPRTDNSTPTALTKIVNPARNNSDNVPSSQKDNGAVTEQTSRDLRSVLEELSNVNEELQQRYLESRHIHDLFIVKCEGLAQRIIELENEVHELKSDILEDTIELEGLRGTVRGLESWVGRWQRQREAAITVSSSNSARKPKSSWRRRRNKTLDEDNEDGNDFDTFLDGVLAWMRGWNDVEEGFLIRARRRKLRRDRKQSVVEREM